VPGASLGKHFHVDSMFTLQNQQRDLQKVQSKVPLNYVRLAKIKDLQRTLSSEQAEISVAI
jgi:hypothetical protein